MLPGAPPSPLFVALPATHRHEIDFRKNDKATFDSKRQGLRRFQVNEPYWGPQSKAKPTAGGAAATKRYGYGFRRAIGHGEYRRQPG